VAESFDRAAVGGLAVVGVARCLLAANEHAVQLLLVDDDRQLAAVVCDNCGWLGLEATTCPVCGAAVGATPDVIDELAAAAIDAGGDVRHVRTESSLTEHLVAALVRFSVPE
jgi:peptide chain release factor subunit 1